ncbi:TPA: exopolysaccharide biosynthesis protein [Streptococcus suis]|nr:exopolysaccharide biosynthesis protein [Streptococcus suis]
MKHKLPINYLGQFYNLELEEHADIQVDDGIIAKNFCSFEVKNYATLRIGKQVFFNSSCVLRCMEKVTIGEYCLFGDGVKIYDNNHHYSHHHIETISFSTAPITIGRHCWVGANSVILKGVTIGDNVIIGAGCTIYKDVPANTIVTSSGTMTYRPRPQFDKQVTTFTASDTLEHLEYLVTSLPDIAFNILAGTHISPHLNSFRRFSNVNIYSNINDTELEDEILNRTSIYLDINHWWEVKDILNRCQQKQIPIYSFDTVAHQPELTNTMISSNHPEEMVQAIQDFFKERDT